MDPNLIAALGGVPGHTYMLGYQISALVAGDDVDRVRSKFQAFVKKLDPGPLNNPAPINSRLKAVKEFDQFIIKRNGKIPKGLKERGLNINIFKRYEFPYCLSAVIIKVQDLVFKSDLKRENKVEVDTMVMRCLLHQRCLIYKMPNFILQFLDQFNDPVTKLNYLQFVTNDGVDMDPLFNSHLYIVLLKLLDTTGKPPTSGVLSLALSILQNHPRCFSETQTTQLILRVSLVGVLSLERKQTETAQEVFQILQFFLKYSEYSGRLLNVCLFTMCILSNREPLTYPVWQVLKNLIIDKDAFIFQEIIGVLQIQFNLPFWSNSKEIQKIVKGQPLQVQQQIKQQNYQIALRKEIQFKCFKSERFDSALELNDLQASFAQQPPARAPMDADKSFARKITLNEIVCQNECPTRYVDPLSQKEEILLLEKRASKQLAKEHLGRLISLLEHDRADWLAYFERNIDKVFKGAVFFIGKALWGTERLEEAARYPINQVLKFFAALIHAGSKFSVLNEVLTATKMLLLNKDIPKYFEWGTVLEMVDLSSSHVEVMLEKKRVDLVQEIFRIAKTPLLMGTFPDHLVNQAFSLYLKYKNAKAFQDKTLTQLMINHFLRNDFYSQFEPLLDSCLLKEKSPEIRSLFLDAVLEFYAGLDGEEDQEVPGLLEAVFLNNLENFYLTRVEGSFSTQQMIQVIDILTYMAHRTEKGASFKHIIEILEQCILCYDFEKQTGISGRMADSIMALSQEQVKMKVFQNHALNRMIQIFVLKGQDMDETDKAVYVFNVLLKILKVSANDRKSVICQDLLQNLYVNTHRELCWLESDNPLFIEIHTRSFCIPLMDHEISRESNDSQGNSSSGGSDSVYPGGALARQLVRGYNEHQNANRNRTSFDKLGQDKQIIQSTLKTLAYCFDDLQSSVETKQISLRLFHKFMPFISDEDFQNLDFSAVGEAGDHPRTQAAQHIRQAASVDNKAEWIRMASTFMKHFDPIREPEYSLLLLDIFYHFLGLDANYKLLPPTVLTSLVETLLESLFIVNNSITKKIKAELEASVQLAQGQPSGSSKGTSEVSANKHKPSQANRRMMGSFAGGGEGAAGLAGLNGNQVDFEDFTPSKLLIKVTKKVISLLGYIFTIDKGYGWEFWNQSAKELLPYIIYQVDPQTGTQIKRVVDMDIKLIEYLIDQLVALSLNNAIMPHITVHILTIVRNITFAIKTDSGFLAKGPPLLVDSLLFLNIRHMLPFMLNKPEYSDPIHRAQEKTFRLSKSLKDLFIAHYCQFKVTDRLYFKGLTYKSEHHNLARHLIVESTSKLMTLTKQQMKGDSAINNPISDEFTLQPILILLGQFETDVKAQSTELEQQGKGRAKEIIKQEGRLRQFIDSLAQNALWSSHSVYDRGCNIRIDQYPVVAENSGIAHYMWGKNILTVRQTGTQIDCIIRNSVFNYRAKLETQNQLAQTQTGCPNQMSKLRNMLLRQSQGRSKEVVQEATFLQPEDIQKLLLNDSTLFALIDPNSHYQLKKTKELLSFPDHSELRKYLHALDAIQPKNSYCMGVTYAPRDAKKEICRTLFDIDCNPEKVTDNFLQFISSLGQMTQIAGGSQGLRNENHALYISGLKLDRFKDLSVNIIMNEDESNFTYYVPNVFNGKDVVETLLSQTQFSRDKVHIIYNESNIHDFTAFDNTKIYLIVSKLNDNYYLVELQHAFMNSIQTQDEPSYQDHNQHENLGDSQINPNFLKSSQIQNTFFFEEVQPSPSTSTASANSFGQQNSLPKNCYLKKYHNGHLTECAIVAQERIGQWITSVAQVSDMHYKNLRYKHKDFITSNIMQRQACIKSIRGHLGKQGRPYMNLRHS